MSSKKYLLLTMLLGFLALGQAFGQSKPISGHDFLDTSYVRSARMDQQLEFLNNESAFPAKPRDMWELGVQGGLTQIIGDVGSRPGFGAGLSLRKALGYTLSLRGQADYLQGKGIGTHKVDAAQLLSGTSAAGQYGAGASIYPNYKMNAFSGSLDLVVSLNNIMFHKTASKTNWYVFGGYTAMFYHTKLDALNGNSAYNMSTFTGKGKDIKKSVKDASDGSYETLVTTGRRSPSIKSYSLRNGLDGGLGVAFKVSPRFNLGLEQKFIVPFENHIDGVSMGRTQGTDVISYTQVRFNFNLGNKAKRTEPLYWVNPLAFAYNELNTPRHMLLPETVLPDADGDGITDQFDKCPDTPAGVPVDVNGCPLDTDGDGVPDYKDKELITPTYCQPVDADGVGKCPEPAPKEVVCDLGTLPSITFTKNRVALSDDAKALLSQVANQMRQSPDCRVVVSGHAESSKVSEQLAWDRVNAVINYLNEQEGIPASRFIFKYKGGAGDNNTVDLRSAGPNEGGPNMVTPPHPNLHKTK